MNIKMNKIINNFLLAGDKFMPEMHLKQPIFSYSTCGPFTKNKEKIQEFKETGDTSYILKMNLIRLVFNMILLIELRDKALILLKILNMMAIKEVLLLWFINFLIKSP